MSALPKVLIIFLVWMLYVFFLIRSCSDELCPECSAVTGGVSVSEAAIEPPPPADTINRYPLGFRWSEVEPYPTEAFDDRRRQILAGMGEDNILEITGLYYEEEDKPEETLSLGLARAEAVRDLFTPEIPPERIRLRARTVERGEDVARSGYFKGVEMGWIQPEEAIAETVEELPDRILIRFKYNSTEKEYDPEVDEYLRKLADRVVETGEQIRLTGHTDDRGTSEYNRRLGRQRAEQIQSILVNKGVDDSQISVFSRGETQPVASNDTPEGRHENRRVEVRLIEENQQ